MDNKKKPKTKKKVEKKAEQEERDAVSDAGAVSSDECEAEISLEAESKAWSAQQLLRDGKRKRLRSHMSCSGSESTLSDEEAPAPKVGTSRKGRGHPSKTGESEDLAKAKAELRDVPRDESRVQVVENVNTLVKDIRRRSDNIFKRTEIAPTRAELTDLVFTGLKTVAAVGQGSGNLKGTFVRALREATNEIQRGVLCLRDMTVDDQVKNYETYITRVNEDKRRLKADNDKLKGDQKKMREELDAVKVELEVIRRQGPSASVTPPAESELLRLFRAEMATLTARFAVIEGKILRPPLAGDCRASEQTQAASYAAKAAVSSTPAPGKAPKKTAPPKAAPSKGAQQKVVSVESQPGPSSKIAASQSKGKGKGKGGKPKENAAASSATASAQDVQSADNPQQGEWQTVQSKKSKKRKAAQKSSQKKKKAANLRVPSSTAVVIALQPGAQEKGISYLSVLTEAKRRIDLGELGIPSLKFKVAVTGARILEIPGAATEEKADALASKLRECVNGDDVRISRPVKCAELRVTGLDETVTSEDVRNVAARVGGCPADAVKVGDIRMGPSGLGSVWMRCPVAAAKAIAGAGRLLVGWVSAGVALLEPRPLQCYRCLYGGHTQHTCLSEEDRSELCYRCSQKGHRANQCPNELHCSLCAAVGKPAAHRIGAKSCEARAMKKKKGGKSQSRAAPQPMDTTQPDTEPASSAQQCSGTATGGRLGEV